MGLVGGNDSATLAMMGGLTLLSERYLAGHAHTDVCHNQCCLAASVLSEVLQRPVSPPAAPPCFERLFC